MQKANKAVMRLSFPKERIKEYRDSPIPNDKVAIMQIKEGIGSENAWRIAEANPRTLNGIKKRFAWFFTP